MAVGFALKPVPFQYQFFWKVLDMQFKLRLVVALSCVPIAIGCGSRPGPQAKVEIVVPVSGTLTYQGNPLESYQISFLPMDGRRPAMGTTDAAGKFTLGTNKVGDGAPPGTHKLTIVWLAPPSTDAPGQETIIDDPALLPKPKIQIPDKYSNSDTSGLTQEVPAGGLKDLKIELQ